MLDLLAVLVPFFEVKEGRRKSNLTANFIQLGEVERKEDVMEPWEKTTLICITSQLS